MGCYPSLCRVHGLEAESGRHCAGRHALPAVQHIRQQALPARRLHVHEGHTALGDNRQGGDGACPQGLTCRAWGAVLAAWRFVKPVRAATAVAT